MSQTIRDVLIRVAIDSKDVKFPTPNLTPAVEALQQLQAKQDELAKQAAAQDTATREESQATEEAVKATTDLKKALGELERASFLVTSATEGQEKAIDKIAKAAVKATSAQQKADKAQTEAAAAIAKSAAASDTDTAAKEAEAKAIDKAAKASLAASVAKAKETKAIEAAAAAGDKLVAAKNREAAAQQQVASIHAATNLQIRQSALQGAEALSIGAQGALQFSRGLTLLAVSSDSDLRVVIESLAKVQAGIDLFKGGTDTIKGLAVAEQSLRAAATAAATAEAGRAAATGVATGATVAGTGAVNALTAAMVANPITATFVLIASAAAAAYAAYKLLGEDGADQVDKAAEATLRLKSAAISAEQAFQTTRLVVDLRRDIRIAQNASAGEQLKGIAEEAFWAEQALRTAQQELREAQKNNTGETSETEAVKTSLEQVLRFQEMIKRSDDDRLNKLKEITQEHENAAQAQQQAVQAAQQALATEQQKLDLVNQQVQSLEEIVGRMTEIERAEFEQLAGRVSGGESLTREELLRLEQLGGAGVKDFTSGQFAEQGRAAGGADLFAPFAGDQGTVREMQNAAQAAVEAARNEVDIATQLLTEMQKIAEEADANRQPQIDKLVATMTKIFGTQKAIADIEKTLQDLQLHNPSN